VQVLLEASVDTITEHVLAPASRHLLVEGIDIRQSAAEDEDFGVENVDDQRQAGRQSLRVAIQGCQRTNFPFGRRTDNLLRRDPVSRHQRVINGQTGARQILLDAPRSTAVTVERLNRTRFVRWKGIVSPLSPDRVGSFGETAVRNDAPSNAGADNHTENGGGPHSGTIHRFGQSEAVGIVGEPNRPVQRAGEITIQRSAEEHR